MNIQEILIALAKDPKEKGFRSDTPMFFLQQTFAGNLTLEVPNNSSFRTLSAEDILADDWNIWSRRDKSRV